MYTNCDQAATKKHWHFRFAHEDIVDEFLTPPIIQALLNSAAHDEKLENVVLLSMESNVNIHTPNLSLSHEERRSGNVRTEFKSEAPRRRNFVYTDVLRFCLHQKYSQFRRIFQLGRSHSRMVGHRAGTKANLIHWVSFQHYSTRII